jgi:hypothetical protein
MLFSKNNHPTGFYVYAYLREDGTPYYIGKGKDGRAWSKQRSVNLPRNENCIIIVEQNLTELGSLAIERRLIHWYGRKDNSTGILRNRTDGGDGVSGIIPSEETREKIGAANKGRPVSEEHRAKIGSSNKGKTHSEETKAKMKATRKGRTISAEHRAKLSAAQRGRPRKPLSEEHRASISAAMKKPKSEEYRAKLSGEGNPFYGKTHTEETRAKMRGPRGPRQKK